MIIYFLYLHTHTHIHTHTYIIQLYGCCICSTTQTYSVYIYILCVSVCVWVYVLHSAFTPPSPQFTQCPRRCNCHGRFSIRSGFDLCYYTSTVNIGHLHCTFYFCISIELREFQLYTSVRLSSRSRPNRSRER